mmetsp:Transcript_27886/g.49481  ORF Transcript_27886/g.49481 Transcript_27886/m.49481 type:complete len:97 (+) Transcript_27886:112-402(+)
MKDSTDSSLSSTSPNMSSLSCCYSGMGQTLQLTGNGSGNNVQELLAILDAALAVVNDGVTPADDEARTILPFDESIVSSPSLSKKKANKEEEKEER